MPVEVIDCKQGEPEWFQARLGLATCSEFSTILSAPKKGEAFSKSRRTYLYKLAGEIVTGLPTESYSNPYMDRGHVMEPEARNAYAFMHDCEPELVGFVRNGRAGCSPDAFVGTDGVLEVKTKAPHILIECLNADKFCPEHVAQCQGALWVTEREWVDLVCYFSRMPLFVKRAYRDEAYIRRLAEEVERFNYELDSVVRFVRNYGLQDEAA